MAEQTHTIRRHLIGMPPTENTGTLSELRGFFAPRLGTVRPVLAAADTDTAAKLVTALNLSLTQWGTTNSHFTLHTK